MTIKTKPSTKAYREGWDSIDWRRKRRYIKDALTEARRRARYPKGCMTASVAKARHEGEGGT